MNTMHTHLCPLAWNVSSMKSHNNKKLSLKTANKRMSLAHCPNMIGPGMFGWRKRGHNGCQQQCFSNTSISQTHQPRQPTPSLQRLKMSLRHCKEKCRYCSMNPPSKPSNTCRKYLVRRRPRRTPRTRRSSHPKPNQQTSFHDDRRASKHALTPKV